MGMGWMAASCLLVASGLPAADEVCHVKDRGFTIPVNIAPGRQGDVRELVLYLSKDEGRTWVPALHLDPKTLVPGKEGQGFNFMAVSDGMHYFTVVTVDLQGRQVPEDVAKEKQVGLKTFIDTVKPAVHVTADRVADEVQVGWDVREDRPNWEKTKLEYKAGPAGAWTPLTVTPGFNDRGQMKFRPPVSGDVTVRLTAEDLAGNVGSDEKTAAATMTVSAAGVAPGAGIARPETMTPPAALPPTPPALPMVNPGVSPPLVGTGPATIAGSPGADAGTRSMSNYGDSGPLAELQIVNKPQAKIGFDVSGFGPSGLGVVDVYLTADEGTTWSPVKLDGGVQMPPPGEAKPGQPATGSVTVTLPKEGVIYGVYVVVKSGAGLGQAPPMSGATKPQMRLEYDATAPIADLHMPKPDPKSKDTMVFTWRAEDRNLDSNPITIQWAASPTGPWDFIGEPQLPNTGRYSWQINNRIPAKVYLKMTVRDKAGNQSEATTPAPIPLDVSLPSVGGLRLLK